MRALCHGVFHIATVREQDFRLFFTDFTFKSARFLLVGLKFLLFGQMDIFSNIESLAHTSPYIVYILVFLAPFVQEDTAVIGTAALTAIGKLAVGPAFIAIVLGLFFSDIWKYWIGWFAIRHRKGADFAKKDIVLGLKEKVLRYPFTTLVAARFIPLTRIPSYIACGFFKLHYGLYCFYIGVTALMFVSIAFGTFHLLGSLLGEHIKWILPFIGLAFVMASIAIQYLKKRRA